MTELQRIEPEKKRGGQWIEVGEVEYRIPPLGFLDVQELKDDIDALQAITGLPTKKQMQTMVRIVHRAIARNYPSMTAEEVGEMLDLGNFQRILFAVLMVSGFERGEAKPGETLASTGPASMPPSSTPMDGPGNTSTTR